MNQYWHNLQPPFIILRLPLPPVHAPGGGPALPAPGPGCGPGLHLSQRRPVGGLCGRRGRDPAGPVAGGV